MKSYIFTVTTREAEDLIFDESTECPFSVDSFHECAGNYDYGDIDIANVDEDFNPIEFDRESYENDAKAYHGMSTRVRYSNGGGKVTSSIYHVKVDDDYSMTRDDLDALLQSKYAQGREVLRDFLKGAAVS